MQMRAAMRLRLRTCHRCASRCCHGCEEQHLDSLRRKDSLRGAETTEISVRLENYFASHFEGSAEGSDAVCACAGVVAEFARIRAAGGCNGPDPVQSHTPGPYQEGCRGSMSGSQGNP